MAKTSKTAKTAKKAAAKKAAKPAKKAAVKKPAAAEAAAHVAREHLPIPDPKHVGLTTYDAKDPNTKYPPITTLRPPDGCAERADRADRRRRLRRIVGVRRAVQHAGGRAAGGKWAEAQPLPHHRAVFARPGRPC